MLALEQLSKESFLWLPTLCAPDPYYILPAAFLTIALTNIKVTVIFLSIMIIVDNILIVNLKYGSLSSVKFTSKIFSYRKNFGIFIIGMMALLVSNMPAVIYIECLLNC